MPTPMSDSVWSFSNVSKRSVPTDPISSTQFCSLGGRRFTTQVWPVPCTLVRNWTRLCPQSSAPSIDYWTSADRNRTSESNSHRSLSFERWARALLQHLLTTLMSHQASIDDIQQSAQMIETEYDIHAVSRAQELQQRWGDIDERLLWRLLFSLDPGGNIRTPRSHNGSSRYKMSSRILREMSIRYQWNIPGNALQRRINVLITSSNISTTRESSNCVVSSSVAMPIRRRRGIIRKCTFEHRWSRLFVTFGWFRLELMRSFSSFNDIRFAAYRTAMKLRALQKRLSREYLSHLEQTDCSPSDLV